jgi:hypothetical protein
MIMSASINAPDGSVVYMLAITVISESDQSIDAEHEVSVYKFGDFNHINPVYLPKGGIGYMEKEIYTFDGDPSDKVTVDNGTFLCVRITPNTPDLNNIIKGSGFRQGVPIELSKDSVFIIVENGVQKAVSSTFGTLVWCVTTPTDLFTEPGLYVVYRENTYITRLEFTGAAVPIDPKYLPEGGVGYTETVTLTTGGSAEGKETFVNSGMTYIRVGGRVNIADITLASGIYQG